MKSLKRVTIIALTIFAFVSAVYLFAQEVPAKNEVKVQTKNKGEATSIQVQENLAYGYGHGFIDEDGDGINDYARDDDGDGIPNGQDPDYQKPMDGTGYKHMYGRNGERGNRGTTTSGFSSSEFSHFYNWGGNSGTGVCDGTGPHGKAHRGGH